MATIAPSPILKRRDAAQATLDRFKDVPFKWGKNDCVRLVAFHLRKLGINPKLANAGSYGSLLGAKRALARAGFATIAEAVDSLGFERITPAAAAVGDIIEWPAENELGALAIAVGNGRVVAYHQDAEGAAVLQLLQFVTAWRVPA